MKNRHIKLIAVDMDGTLLRSDKTVGPDTLRDIGEARGHGIEVAYCTGRSVAELSPYTDVLAMMRYGVCLCGAQIYDFRERRSLHKRAIGMSYVRQIVSISEEYGAMVQLLTEDKSLVRSDQVEHMEDYHLKAYKDMFKKIATGVGSMEEAIKNYGTILKSNVHFPDEKAREEAFCRLKALPLSFVFSETSTIEIMSKGVSKASGLSMLASFLSIPMHSVMAIGDGNNDRDTLLKAGVSVAMGNAGQELKAAADIVTEDNDHNGSGLIIRQCINDIG